MLTMQMIGRLREDAKIIGANRNCLAAVVVVSERGFGAAAGKTFKRSVKVVMFGKSIHDLAPKLIKDTLVSVAGKPEAESYEGRGGGAKACLKCVGQIEIEESVAPPVSEYDQAPGQAQPAADPTNIPEEEGDYPF